MGDRIYARTSIEEARNLRTRACEVIMECEHVPPDVAYSYLMKLLKLRSLTFASGLRKESLDTLRKLAGPHGYAIYKALLAQKTD